MRIIFLAALAVSLWLPMARAQSAEQEFQAVYRWKQHDLNRPVPPVIMPGTASTQNEAGKPTSDAVVLFDGKDLSRWESESGGPAKWKVANGYMEVVKGTGNIRTREDFGDCQLHVEWAAPLPAVGESQERGNSGVFLMGKYEIQVLDSYHKPDLCRWAGGGGLRAISAAGERLPAARTMANLRHHLPWPAFCFRLTAAARENYGAAQWRAGTGQRGADRPHCSRHTPALRTRP